jgi:hypothetical protein
LPVTAIFSGPSEASVGSGVFFDSSATDVRLTNVGLVASTSVSFRADDSANTNLGSSPSVALGNNDVISFSIMYEAA